MVVKAFTEHPSSVGESYFQHMRHSFSFARKMLFGGMACFLHGIFPFICTRTGSTQILTLHDRMVTNRDQQTPTGKTKVTPVHSFIPEYYI